jgi:hypothetical protein
MLVASPRQRYMREIRKINVAESVSKRRLIFDESWMDKLNRLAVVIFFGQLIYLPLIVMYYENFANTKEISILHWILLILIVIGLYGIIRALTEKHLIKITTVHDKQTIRTALLDYADRNKFEIYRDSNNCIILNSPNYLDLSSYTCKTRIFFFKDGLLLFTVIRDNLKINLPVLFTHLLIRRDITKSLRKAST